MLGPKVKFCLKAVRSALSGIITFTVWTVWLLLVVLLGLQIYVASTNQLQVPTFVQKAILDKLAVSGVHITFGNTIFDPSGSILIENARVTLDGFDEPIATIQSLYARIDPTALALQRVEPLELRVSGVTLRVPAMLSPSGRADEIVKDLDADFIPKAKSLKIEYLRGHLGNLLLSVSGEVPFGDQSKAQKEALPVADLLARNYPSISKRCAIALSALGIIENPYLRITLIPSADGEVAECMLGASGLRLTDPIAMQLSQINASARIPINGSSMDIEELVINADRMNIPSANISARGARIIIKGIRPKSLGSESKSPLEMDGVNVSASRLMVKGIALQAPILKLSTKGGDVLTALGLFDHAGTVNVSAKAWVLNEPDSFDGVVDLNTHMAVGSFVCKLPAAALDLVSAQLKKDLGKYIHFNTLLQLSGHLSVNPGWVLKDATAYLDGGDFSILDVNINELRGNFNFAGNVLKSEDAYARIGNNFARGTIEEHFSDHTFRYLIKGKLRPLEISSWVPQAWWRDLFSPFAFTDMLPEADLDFSGSMLDTLHAKSFVSVQSTNPVIKGVPFDNLSTTIFSRPQYVDTLNFDLKKLGYQAQGRFTRSLDIYKGISSQIIEFQFKSNLSLEDIGSLGGQAAKSGLAIFKFMKPPLVEASGRVSGINSGIGEHKNITIKFNSDSEFRLNGFPLDGVKATVYVKDNDIILPDIVSSFAGGALTGKVRLSGDPKKQDLNYEGTLTDARLDKAIFVISSFSADRKHREPQGLEAFLKDKSAVLFSASSQAKGVLGMPYSFHGTGDAHFHGSELGQVKMLGLLSELFRFTSLRFTSAHAQYKIDGSKLNFSEVSVVGANSAITAAGSFTFGTKQLDFKARINPFQQSKNLPQQVMDVVLSPVSQVFEVQLKGTVDKPSWSFANSPVTILRDLAEKQTPPEPPQPTKTF